MKRILASGFAVLLLAACTTAYENQPVETAEAPMADAQDLCGASALQDYIGKPGNAENKAALQSAATAGFRWIPYGTPVTRDLRRNRLNVSLDQSGVIERIACF